MKLQTVICDIIFMIFVIISLFYFLHDKNKNKNKNINLNRYGGVKIFKLFLYGNHNNFF